MVFATTLLREPQPQPPTTLFYNSKTYLLCSFKKIAVLMWPTLLFMFIIDDLYGIKACQTLTSLCDKPSESQDRRH